GDQLQNEIDVHSLRPYSSGTITGVVSVEPKIEKGGHVMFAIKKDDTEIKCAVYKETGITEQASSLIVGDKIRVGGGVRKASHKHSRALNVEFFQVLSLEKKHILVNPMCTKCKKHMKSKGQGQGFECVKCGRKSPKKETRQVSRQIKKQIYIPQMSAHRHLTRPQQRLGITNKESRFDKQFQWVSVY
ncbi:MAG TPA: DNA-binding protein, partial [Candidatus Nitrosotenuis sp.]|nr:DNA-binding protein [Candidatus Nitrosotenuis sp.]